MSSLEAIHDDRPIRVIEPGRTQAFDLRLLWQHRAMLYFLALRDIKVRYRQAALGVAWVVLQPLLSTLVLAAIWSRFIRSDDHVPYMALVFTAFVPWSWFSTSITQASTSLVANASLITKIYFPRETIPLATMLAACLDALVLVPVVAALLAWYGCLPTVGLALAPLFLLLLCVATTAVSLLASGLTLRFRDVRSLVPFGVQVLFLASPVAYTSDIIPARWRTLYALNPLSTVIDGLRWGLLGTAPPPLEACAVSAGVSLLGLAAGVFAFRRLERGFADYA